MLKKLKIVIINLISIFSFCTFSSCSKENASEYTKIDFINDFDLSNNLIYTVKDNIHSLNFTFNNLSFFNNIYSNEKYIIDIGKLYFEESLSMNEIKLKSSFAITPFALKEAIKYIEKIYINNDSKTFFYFNENMNEDLIEHNVSFTVLNNNNNLLGILKEDFYAFKSNINNNIYYSLFSDYIFYPYNNRYRIKKFNDDYLVNHYVYERYQFPLNRNIKNLNDFNDELFVSFSNKNIDFYIKNSFNSFSPNIKTEASILNTSISYEFINPSSNNLPYKEYYSSPISFCSFLSLKKDNLNKELKINKNMSIGILKSNGSIFDNEEYSFTLTSFL